MSNITWAFPASEEELGELLSHPGMILHGGGTGILRNPPKVGLLVDTTRAGVSAINAASDPISIGGAATYADVIREVGSLHPNHLLVAALRVAAAPALRNRFTIGGSLALFPPWSSLVGPLVALDATVRVIGAANKSMPVATYVTDRSLQEHTAIAEIGVPTASEWRPAFHRYVRTRLTYPLFTVTVLLSMAGGAIEAARIVLVGCRDRFARLSVLEDRLVGLKPSAVTVAGDELGTTVPDRQGLSSDYLTHVAAVEIERAVHAAGGAKSRGSSAAGGVA